MFALTAICGAPPLAEAPRSGSDFKITTDGTYTDVFNFEGGMQEAFHTLG